MGKAIASEAIQPEKRLYQSGHPDCRCLTQHAVSPPSPQMQRFREDKIDLLMEGYLIYGETLEQGAHRILRQTLPTAPLDHLHFNFMYHF